MIHLPRRVSRRLAVLALSLLAFLPTRADEGMWLPLLLKSLNETDMQRKGLRLSADDIYSINHSTLKDAIVQFGGGCTGEIISPDGLLLTNHHCGFGQIQQHSSVEHDYLTNGFWAKTRADEKPNPGLTAMFIVRMEDVTAQVLKEMPRDQSETDRDKLLEGRLAEITKQATAGTHYQAFIRPFFYGQEYYMFVTETYTDVRLVGAPPSGIGKFGGDTDNWMWPRHTGDFSIFRVYAGPDGKPAPYAPANVPLKPRHFLPISLAPVEEGDFTLVFGFPGRTTEYLTSWAVNELANVTDPARVALRDARLKRWDVAMKSSDRLRIAYAAKQASLANYWKKWIGEMKGLQRLDAVKQKEAQETRFREWVSADPKRKAEYGAVLPGIEQQYRGLADYSLAATYVSEGTLGVELFAMVNNSFMPLADALRQPTPDLAKVKELVDKLRPGLANYYKNYDAATDQLICADLLRKQAQAVPGALQPANLKIAAGAGNDFTAFAQAVFSQSNLTTLEKCTALLDRVAAGDKNALLLDPAYTFTTDVMAHYRSAILPTVQRANEAVTPLMRMYVKGLREMQTDRKFYPDANSTLRVAYGNVNGYQPADGVKYRYYTTIDGIMEKYDPTNEEFNAPKKLIDAYQRRDFGDYAVNGTVPVAFTASNHTTGGNSGSPVLNGRGELMGLNFDRVWEGTMSDVMFDPAMCRNIMLDMHYLLFVIDKVGDSKHLIQEMKIVREPHPDANSKPLKKAKAKKEKV